jgi:beta-phosphoglucomutase-like phosphatase (HAD superfamily)
MSKIYVFDLDGTLVDSMAAFGMGILSVLDEEGILYGPDMIQVVTPLGYTKSAELYVKMGVKDTVEHIVSRVEARLVREYAANVFLKAGVGDYLRKIHAEGARLFVLTASPHSVTDICLKHNGVYDLFEQVWSVDDFGKSKSDVTIFYDVAKTIGCEVGEVNYFDDNLMAVTNANKAGYVVYGVYDGQEEELWKKIGAQSHTVVNSFEDMV